MCSSLTHSEEQRTTWGLDARGSWAMEGMEALHNKVADFPS